MFGDTRCQVEILARDAVLQPLLAEVRAPRPAHDHGLDRIAARGDAELAVAVERDRADVALRQAVGADQLVVAATQLVDRERDLHVAAGAPSCGGAACGRRAGRRPGPSACRSSECPRRRPSRSAGRGRRRGSSRRPSRRARRSSRSSRSPARRAPFWPLELEFYPARDEVDRRAPRRGAASSTGGERRHVRLGVPAPIQTTSWSSSDAVHQHPRDRALRKRRHAAGLEAGRLHDLVGARDAHVLGAGPRRHRPSSARRSPGTSASTNAPSQTNTSDLTICDELAADRLGRVARGRRAARELLDARVDRRRREGPSATRSTGSGHGTSAPRRSGRRRPCPRAAARAAPAARGESIESAISALPPSRFRETAMFAMFTPASPNSVPTRPITPGMSS